MNAALSLLSKGYQFEESIQYQIEPGRCPRAHIVTWDDSAASSVFEGKQATGKGGAVPVIYVSRKWPHCFIIVEPLGSAPYVT